MLVYGPTGAYRHTLDTMAHILAGPISFLGFLNGGFTGSFFFFLSLWHFLCDSGRARPSYLRERPRTREEFWIWFESLWLLVRCEGLRAEADVASHVPAPPRVTAVCGLWCQPEFSLRSHPAASFTTAGGLVLTGASTSLTVPTSTLLLGKLAAAKKLALLKILADQQQ